MSKTEKEGYELKTITKTEGGCERRERETDRQNKLKY